MGGALQLGVQSTLRGLQGISLINRRPARPFAIWSLTFGSIMGLGVLEDRHLEHVPGTALLADMLNAQEHRYHGMHLSRRLRSR